MGSENSLNLVVDHFNRKTQQGDSRYGMIPLSRALPSQHPRKFNQRCQIVKEAGVAVTPDMIAHRSSGQVAHGEGQMALGIERKRHQHGIAVVAAHNPASYRPYWLAMEQRAAAGLFPSSTSWAWSTPMVVPSLSGRDSQPAPTVLCGFPAKIFPVVALDTPSANAFGKNLPLGHKAASPCRRRAV